MQEIDQNIASEPEGQPSRRRRKKRPIQPLRLALFFFGSAVVALSVYLGIVWITSSPTDPDADFAAQLKAATAQLPLNLVSATTLGRDDAPVKLITFEDFQCLFCLKFAATQEPQLIQEYVNTGKVQIIYQSLIRLGPESTAAANAAECVADQGKFWQYYDLLYEKQAEAGQYADEKVNIGRFSQANLEAYARTVGVNLQQYRQCVSTNIHQAKIDADQRDAANYGIKATPGFVVNGVSHGSGAPATMDDWRNILNSALSQASASK